MAFDETALPILTKGKNTNTIHFLRSVTIIAVTVSISKNLVLFQFLKPRNRRSVWSRFGLIK